MFFTIAAATMLFSCTPENEDVVAQPEKDGTIETSITTKHAKDCDILTTEYKVWIKGKVNKTFSKIDTLQSLGTTKEEGEDKAGNTKDITVQKEYEIYITVK